MSDLADISMTWSALKMMALCPAKVRHVAMQPSGGEHTLAMRMGSGVAALTFGTPDVVVYTKQRRKGTAAKPSEWDGFQAENAGKVILNLAEHANAMSIAMALKHHDIAGPLLFGAGVQVEVPMLWSVDGRAYRTRGVDFVNDSASYIGELKVARTTQPGRFERDSLRALYPAQVETYDEGHAIVTGRDRTVHPFDKYIIAVEPTPPYVVTVYKLTESAIRQARRTIGLYRSRLKSCEEANTWPGYSLGVVPFEVEESDYDAAAGEDVAPDAGPFEPAAWSSDDTATDESF